MTFDLPEKNAVKKAEIILTADDRFTLYINGKQAGKNRRGNDAWRDAPKMRYRPTARSGPQLRGHRSHQQQR